MLTKLPGMSQVPDAVKSQMDDSVLTKMEAMIRFHDQKERVKPEIIKGSLQTPCIAAVPDSGGMSTGCSSSSMICSA